MDTGVQIHKTPPSVFMVALFQLKYKKKPQESNLQKIKKRPCGRIQTKKELTPERCIFHLHQARVSSLNSWYLTSI